MEGKIIEILPALWCTFAVGEKNGQVFVISFGAWSHLGDCCPDNKDAAIGFLRDLHAVGFNELFDIYDITIVQCM